LQNLLDDEASKASKQKPGFKSAMLADVRPSADGQVCCVFVVAGPWYMVYYGCFCYKWITLVIVHDASLLISTLCVTLYRRIRLLSVWLLRLSIRYVFSTLVTNHRPNEGLCLLASFWFFSTVTSAVLCFKEKLYLLFWQWDL
jgi:hypothetical protein